MRRLFAGAYVVALQFAIEGGAADAEHLAGQSLVSLDLGEDALDGGALDVFQIGSVEVGTGEFWRIVRFGPRSPARAMVGGRSSISMMR